MNIEENKMEYVKCNLCGNNNYTYLNYEGENKVVKCNICGLIYRNPRTCFALDREPDSLRVYGSYTEAEEYVSQAREKFFKRTLHWLDKKISKSDRKVLDIGCGQGYFLKLAKDRGWQISGIELAKSACDYAKQKFGIDIINKSIKEANLKDKSFDLVTLWNVLDHLLDPLNTLKEIYRILKPGGILVIRVPNVNFHLFLHRMFSLFSFLIRNKKFRDPSVIVNYGFSKKTIEKILLKVGFRDIRVYNSHVSQGDPYKLFGISESLISIIKQIIYLMSILIFYISAKRCIFGSSILVYAQK